MQVFNIIKENHRKLREQLSELTKDLSDMSEFRYDKFEDFKRFLLSQERAEESSLYVRISQFHNGSDLALKALEEHRLCDHLISELDDLELIDPRWRVRFEILKDVLGRHLKEEDELVLPFAKSKLSTEESEIMTEEYLKLQDMISKEIQNQQQEDFMIIYSSRVSTPTVGTILLNS